MIKTPEQRKRQSILMKQLWTDGKIIAPSKKIRQCFVCGKEFIRKDVKNHRKTCSNKCWIYFEQHKWNFHPHPKGMLGKTHSDKVKKEMSTRVKEMWKNPKSKCNKKEFRQSLSDRNIEMYKKGILGRTNTYSRAKRGWWKSKDKKYFMRSSWEMNYACYLEFLIKQKQIKNWEYEPDTFW